MREEYLELPNTELCEKLLSKDNIEKAIHHVVKNKGSAGIDGMGVKELKPYVKEHFDEIKSKILARTYHCKPVRKVEIPKDNGDVRILGIPTVLDRMIQQAVVQVISPMFEETFSDFSFGYRPHRSAEDAVRQVQTYILDGYQYIISIDLSKFFDTVNHDKLMSMVDSRLEDKDIRRLIFEFIKSGTMENGVKIDWDKGTPQGGVISPLLSNIYLNSFDKEMEKRGVRFSRYSDDIVCMSKTKMAAFRIRDNAIKFLENKLNLVINKDKTTINKVIDSEYLGFKFATKKWKIEKGLDGFGHTLPRDKSWRKLESRVREITKRNRGVSLEFVIGQLNSLLRGWIAYYSRTTIKVKLEKFMAWVKRRVRQYAYKLWKTGRNRKRQLRKLGVSNTRLGYIKLSSNRYWYMAKALGPIFSNQILHEMLGLLDAVDWYVKKHKQKVDSDNQILSYLKQKDMEEEGRIILLEGYLQSSHVKYLV